MLEVLNYGKTFLTTITIIVFFIIFFYRSLRFKSRIYFFAGLMAMSLGIMTIGLAHTTKDYHGEVMRAFFWVMIGSIMFLNSSLANKNKKKNKD